MQHYILVLVLVTLVRAYPRPVRLRSREILPRAFRPRPRPNYPRTQASYSTLTTPVSSRPNSPLRPHPIGLAVVEGTIHGPGLTVTNTHSQQDPAHARLLQNTRYANAHGHSSAMITTSSDAGSIHGASASHKVVVAVRNGPTTETCVDCHLPGGLQQVRIGPGGVSELEFNNPQPWRAPAMVVVRQSGPGAITSVGINHP